MPKPRPPIKLHGSSTPDGPALRALTRYVLLLGIDAGSAADLFTEDGEYRLTLEGKPLRLSGRPAIRKHLTRSARMLKYELSFFRQDGNCAMAEITISAPDWGKVVEMVLVRMAGDLIAEFEILTW
jgi:hypothetical protein